MSQEPIYIISDGTGQTAENVVRACLLQFNQTGVRVQTFPNVVDAEQLQRLFRLAASYRLPGAGNKLTVGGSVNYQSGIYYDESSGLGRASQGGVTLLGLMARYEFSKQVAASINIDNLTDKRYYSGLGGYNGYNYGTPRNVWMKVSYKF